MKSAFAIAFLSMGWVIGSVGAARADDPLPIEEPVASEQGGAAEAPAPATAARPEPVPVAPAPAASGPAASGPAASAPVASAPAASTPVSAGKPETKQARVSSPQTRGPGKPRAVDDGDRRLEKKEDTVLGGKHWRIKTAQGAVHVWVPPGYDRETAGTVVYVHGYYTSSDGAWRDHELAKQFKASRQNAMFVVPDAPAGNDQHVRWPALTDLRRAVTRANLRLPDGPIVVMGHSGAFRTVMQWVDHRHVDQIILLDALYAGASAFHEYIQGGKRADQHRMIVIGADTAQDSVSFAKKYKFAVVREKMPSSTSSFSKRERGAKLLYIRSQYDHMSIVTSGKVIPQLLRLTRLKAL